MATCKHDEHHNLKEKLETLREHFSTLTTMLAVKPIEHVLKFIGHIWGCDHNNICKTSLQVLFMILEDKNNHDVSAILHRILSEDPGKVLEAFVDIHGHSHRTAKQSKINKPSKINPAVKSPESLEELCIMMQTAADRRQKIKGISTKYSKLWNDIGDSDGITIDTSRLCSPLTIDCLKSNIHKHNYCQFEAGIRIEDIQEHLWPSEHRTTKHSEKFRVLETATSGASLSLAGTVSTGAHGNGLTTGIMADGVVSFQIFTVDQFWRVKGYQIESWNGITDPEKFKVKYQNDEYHRELIQDDEVFRSSAVNIGCIGVVYSYVLRTVPGFCLEEERKIYLWSEGKKVIQDLYNGKISDLYNFQIIASPYAYKLSPKEKEENRILISTLKRTSSPAIGKRPGGIKLVPIESLDTALVAAGETSPHIVPVVMHFSLMYLAHVKVVLSAPEALNTLSGIVAGDFADVQTSECAMRLEGANTVVQIIDELHRLFNGIRSKNQSQLVNVPFAVRFTAKTDKYMAMAYDLKKPSITVEQSILSGTPGSHDTLRNFRKKLKSKFRGRPHWGLLQDINSDDLAYLYDETSRRKFYCALNYFDPNFLFENRFAERVFGQERRRQTDVVEELSIAITKKMKVVKIS